MQRPRPQQPTQAQEQGKSSGMLDYRRIDPETLTLAVAELNSIADKHAILLQHDHALTGGILHYQNLLLDAQEGDAAALEHAASPAEFDKLLELAEEQSISDTDTAVLHDGARDGFDDGTALSNRTPELEYLALREDLMKFRSHFLTATDTGKSVPR